MTFASIFLRVQYWSERGTPDGKIQSAWCRPPSRAARLLKMILTDSWDASIWQAAGEITVAFAQLEQVLWLSGPFPFEKSALAKNASAEAARQSSAPRRHAGRSAALRRGRCQGRRSRNLIPCYVRSSHET